MESRPSTSSSPIEAYKTIANNMSEKISHRLVVDGEKVKSKGLWGRFVMFLSELGRPSKCKTRNNDVMDHFEKAIKDSYSDNTLTKILVNVASLKQKLQNENRSLRARDVRNLLQSTEQQEPERQNIHQAQITDSDEVVPSSRGENFKSNDPIAQLSPEIKEIMTPAQLNNFKNIMSAPSAEKFRYENDLSMDEICALVLATHFEDTAEQVQAATGANAENSKYRVLSPLLDSALTKLPDNTEPVATLWRDPLTLTNHFTDDLGTEKIHTSLISARLGEINSQTLEIFQYHNSVAIVTYQSKIGKLVNLGKTDDPDNIFIVFKPGSRHTVKNVDFYKVKKDDPMFQVFNNNDPDDKNANSYRSDDDGNLIGACMVVINVT